MSVSPFHGGLEFRENLTDYSYPTLIEEQVRSVQATVSSGAKAAQDSNSSEAKQMLSSKDLNQFFNPQLSTLSLQEKFDICYSINSDDSMENLPGELMALLKRKQLFNCYDGFEPSGRMHIAQGIMKAINVNKLTKCGGVFTFWIADWFALLNNKMGGDLDKIRVVGAYFVEVWKAAGMNLSNVRFLWASEEIGRNPDEYWSRVMDISRNNSITRIKKCGQIMGRGEGDDQPTSQILYPCMQCADVFYLKADIC
jgi:tyrosyl-tRNA synthetase